MKLKDIENKLNNEYKRIGVISIKEISETTLDHSQIDCIPSIISRIEPLSSDEPIIVSILYQGKYQLIDGYHRLKYAIENDTKIKAVILESFSLKRKSDTFLNFIENTFGSSISFINDYVLSVDGKFYRIEPNEGCGGCGNGWSSIEVSPKMLNKKINVKAVKTVDVKEDVYELYINEEFIAMVDTGYGNGYYGGDFNITF